jgi:putative oligomerization/nucleic acid binding protein
VIFGLRLTAARGLGPMGKFFTVMIVALTVPPMILIALFQIIAVTHSPIRLTETEEPFFILSFLMYIPIGIILFLLTQQKKIVSHAQAAAAKATQATEHTERNLVRELEEVSALKDKGLITDEEFQRIKTRLLSKL